MYFCVVASVELPPTWCMNSSFKWISTDLLAVINVTIVFLMNLNWDDEKVTTKKINVSFRIERVEPHPVDAMLVVSSKLPLSATL